MLRVSGFYDASCTNGDGWRSVIFFSGCPHRCFSCQNPDTWNYDHGYDVSVTELLHKIDENAPIIDGITLSGGEPFQERHVKQIIELTDAVKADGFNVWCYTGYRFEQLVSNPTFRSMLEQIDTLVDGQFEKENFCPDLKFRGSSNQRIIDVQESLILGKVVILDDTTSVQCA